MFTELAFYLAFVHWASLRRRVISVSGLPVLLLGLLSLAFPVFVSTRQVVLMILVRCVVIWLIVRGAPKLRYLLAIAIAGLILVSSMLALRRGASDVEELRSSLAVEAMLEFTVGGRHFLDLTKTAHVLDAVPERLDYQHGGTFLTWIVAPIPRTLWPQKPAIGAGKQVGQAVFDAPRYTGVPPGLIGELHLNFGPPAIFIGLLAFGMLLRSLYETFRPTFFSRSGVLLYTVIATRLALDMIAGQVSGSMAKLLQELIPLLLVMLYCARVTPRGRSSDDGAWPATSEGGDVSRPTSR